jgi:hypothetical protein
METLTVAGAWVVGAAVVVVGAAVVAVVVVGAAVVVVVVVVEVDVVVGAVVVGAVVVVVEVAANVVVVDVDVEVVEVDVDVEVVLVSSASEELQPATSSTSAARISAAGKGRRSAERCGGSGGSVIAESGGAYRAGGQWTISRRRAGIAARSTGRTPPGSPRSTAVLAIRRCRRPR